MIHQKYIVLTSIEASEDITDANIGTKCYEPNFNQNSIKPTICLEKKHTRLLWRIHWTHKCHIITTLLWHWHILSIIQVLVMFAVQTKSNYIGQSNLTQGCIAATHGRFGHIRQGTPMCNPYIESQKRSPWQQPLDTRSWLCLHRITWPRKPTLESNSVSLAIIQPKL